MKFLIPLKSRGANKKKEKQPEEEGKWGISQYVKGWGLALQFYENTHTYTSCLYLLFTPKSYTLATVTRTMQTQK